MCVCVHSVVSVCTAPKKGTTTFTVHANGAMKHCTCLQLLSCRAANGEHVFLAILCNAKQIARSPYNRSTAPILQASPSCSSFFLFFSPLVSTTEFLFSPQRENYLAVLFLFAVVLRSCSRSSQPFCIFENICPRWLHRLDLFLCL